MTSVVAGEAAVAEQLPQSTESTKYVLTFNQLRGAAPWLVEWVRLGELRQSLRLYAHGALYAPVGYEATVQLRRVTQNMQGEHRVDSFEISNTDALAFLDTRLAEVEARLVGFGIRPEYRGQ